MLALAAAACHHRGDPAHEARVLGASPKAAAAPSAAGSTGAPSFAEVDEVRTSRIEDLFAGRYPGLDVRRTGDGGISMRLRGVQPLLLIDGLEAEPVALLAVQPRSVLRIEVLRNITETAIYGSRGVNGVVRVTTRR